VRSGSEKFEALVRTLGALFSLSLLVHFPTPL
jgi:hypothetical protein